MRLDSDNPTLRAPTWAHVCEQTSTTHDGTLRSKHKAALFECSFVVVSVCFCYARNRRMQPASPRRPIPTKPKLAGSGTAEGGSAAGAANREKEASRSDCVAGGGGVIEV